MTAVAFSIIVIVGVLVVVNPAYATQPTCGTIITTNTTLRQPELSYGYA